MTPEERFERIERQLEFSAGILAQLCNSQQRQDAEIEQNPRQIEQNSRQIAQLAAYNPFPEPQTIPAGWDLSGMLAAPERETLADEDAEN